MKQAAAGASSGCSLEGPTKCTWAVRWASPYHSGLAALCDLFCVRVLMLDGGGPARLFFGSGPCSYGSCRMEGNDHIKQDPFKEDTAARTSWRPGPGSWKSAFLQTQKFVRSRQQANKKKLEI